MKEKIKEKGRFAGFDSAEELVSAYLALKKQVAQMHAEKSQDIQSEDAAMQTDVPAQSDTMTEQADNAGKQDSDGWAQTVKEFVSAYPLAGVYGREIGEQLRTDSAICRQPYCLEVALARVLADKLSRPQEFVQQEFFRNAIEGCEEIKQEIIQRYLEDVRGNRPPCVIAGRGSITATPPQRPANVHDAGKILEQMLINRRI